MEKRILSGILAFVPMLWAQTDSARITFANHNEEDPWLTRARDGTFYLSFFSDSLGTADIWVTKSVDGVNWDAPWTAIQGPDDDWLPSIAQAPNGVFHMVWFRRNAVTTDADIWHSNSNDAVNWNAPTKITDTSSVDWVPNFRIDRAGTLWVTWASNRTGQMDLFITRSTDGVAWSSPARITTDTSQDVLPFLFQKRDGSFILTWQRYSGPIFPYITPGCEILYATSPDGLAWSTPMPVTNDTGTAYVDILPIVYDDSANGEYRFAWTSDRFSGLGGTVVLPLSGIQSGAAGRDALPLPGDGYCARILPTGTPGQFLMVWVADPDRDGKADIYHQFVGAPGLGIRKKSFVKRWKPSPQMGFDVKGRRNGAFKYRLRR